MRIRLLTFHTPKNYGAVLQAFSLYTYIKRINEDTLIIDYNTEALRANYKPFKKPNGIKELIKVFIQSPHYGAYKRRYKKFDDFVTSHLGLTERFESTEALYAEPPVADIVFTGSDQVFNPNRIESERKAFYLDFVPNKTKRASYAASFGVSDIPPDKAHEIKAYLEKFDYISVRESQGVELVERMTTKNSIEVLDPVFLNTKEFWISIAKPYKIKNQKYIFYYCLMGGKASDLAARELSKQMNLPLVVMTQGILRIHADEILRDIGPEEFLYLINNAEYIVTDSFHGVAFSLIFEKQFFALPVAPDKMHRQNTILSKVGLLQRIYNNCVNVKDNIQYEPVNEKLRYEIDKSKQFIDNVLSGEQI
jgi:hypothetical protein